MATAVLAMMAAMTACTTANDDNPLPDTLPPPDGMVIPNFTLRINATRSDYTAATRTLTATEDDASVSTSFLPDLPIRVYEVIEKDAGDGMAKVEESYAGLFKQDNPGKDYNYSGELYIKDPEISSLRLYYDYKCASIDALPDQPDYTNQKGTLEDISANFDYAFAEIPISDYDLRNQVVLVLTDDVVFTNQQAIAKFSFVDENGNALNVTGLTVSTITQSFSATLTAPCADVYMALPSIQNTNVTLTATANGAEYKTTLKKQSFKRGKYYPMTLTVERKSSSKINLSKLTSHITLMDGDELTGTLDGSTQRVMLTIADGATVTLNDAQILGHDFDQNKDQWAGITCAGNATIILKGTNQVVTFNRSRAAIQAGPVGSTLTIKGDGNLTVGRTENHNCTAAIGASYSIPCGNIVIEGGNITATAGDGSGIGSCSKGSCGNITITGGNITATAGHGAGIGSSHRGSCGNITITGGTVTAFGAIGAGIGSSSNSSCGDITITGGSIFAQGSGRQAGIGSSYGGSCGNITISCSRSFVSVKAICGYDAPFAIGPSSIKYSVSQCGTITFDGTIVLQGNSYYDYNPKNGDYGNLHLEITTTRLGDEDLREGNEHCYDDNTWTLTPIPSN